MLGQLLLQIAHSPAQVGVDLSFVIPTEAKRSGGTNILGLRQTGNNIGGDEDAAGILFPPAPAAVVVLEVVQAIEAGVVEELVVVALLVTALEQARTKVWVIYAVGIALRLSYHVYYGWGVIVLVLWAAAAIWLFRRTRRITPLIVAHMVYDTFGAFVHEVPHPPVAVGGLIGLAIYGVVIVVIVRAIQIALRGRTPAHR